MSFHNLRWFGYTRAPVQRPWQMLAARFWIEKWLVDQVELNVRFKAEEHYLY